MQLLLKTLGSIVNTHEDSFNEEKIKDMIEAVYSLLLRLQSLEVLEVLSKLARMLLRINI